MQLVEFRNYFKESIVNLYGEEETQSFFYLLAEAYLPISKAEIPLNLQRQLTDEELLLLKNALFRLQNEEPIQYILGKTEFYGLPFDVNPSVLIPRPETEELVDWIIKTDHSSHPTILDIGAGSGCIAVSLAKNLPKATVFAMDISEKTIEVAKKNAIINQVSVAFIKENILEVNQLPQMFDIIVSNPPYVRENKKQLMQNNVVKNEPHLALFVPDADPLLFYKKIISLAKTHLKPGGNLYFEINEAYGKETVNLLINSGFMQVELKKDFYGKDRMIKAMR